jgi:hypothetical protein
MKRSGIVRCCLVGVSLPWCALVACGGPQEPPPAAPIVIEPAVALPSPSSAPYAVAIGAASGSASPVASAAPPADEPSPEDGTMWGDSIGDAFGAGGLGLSGSGGGGGDAGIGLGNIRTLGHPPSTGGGAVMPSLRQGPTTVSGRLPPEVIQRIVRQNFGRYRLCYENGLRTNPTLTGRVAVSFVIDRSGAVKSARDGGSDLPDKGVVSCVVRGFATLSFPQPEKGEVSVTYPILFNPGSPPPAPSTSGSAKPRPKRLGF